MLRVVKIGGNVTDSPGLLGGFLEEFTSLESPKILVHGGGKHATRLAGRLGIENNMIDGRRITDATMLDIVIQCFTAVNKKLVAQLQALGNRAVGLSGADLNCIRAKKRIHPEVDYGYVGDIEKVNFGGIQALLDNGVVPVFCALTHDGNGQLLNTNADTIASAIAGNSDQESELIYCFEKNGVLTDENEAKSVIDVLNQTNYQTFLQSGVIHSGMKPKLDNAFEALRNGVKQVRITNYRLLDKGTEIQL